MVAADAAGAVLGYGVAWANPILTPGHGDLRIRVHGRYGRQGIGTALETHLAAWAAGAGIGALEADVQEDDPQSWAWANRLGYERQYQLYESRLALPNWDPAPFAGALATVRAHGYRLSTLAREAEGEERLRRRYALALDWTKAQGVPEIITENHTLNEPMLAVNRKLGYVPRPGTFHLCRPLV